MISIYQQKIPTNLLENLLEWSRAQSDRISFEPYEFEFIEACNEVLEALNANAKGKNIAVKYFASARIELFADENMFKTIL
jgi:signal transduction histidine kinase